MLHFFSWFENRFNADEWPELYAFNPITWLSNKDDFDKNKKESYYK